MSEADPRISGCAPEPPPSAVRRFGGELALARRYADLLASDGVTRGLLGPREVPRLWERHLLNCAAPATVPRAGDRVGDVGSGAGLPGLVVAILRPDVTVTLIEPLLRRSSFLVEAVAALELRHVEVRRARAEECADLRGSFDIVLARAVAPLERLAAWTVPLVRPGGRVLALKGASAGDELEVARPVLDRLGVAGARVLSLGPSDDPTTVVEIVTAAQPRRRSLRRC